MRMKTGFFKLISQIFLSGCSSEEITLDYLHTMRVNEKINISKRTSITTICSICETQLPYNLNYYYSTYSWSPKPRVS